MSSLTSFNYRFQNKYSEPFESNWTIKNKDNLSKIIAQGKSSNRIVVFDFDNTLLCGDIGESVFESLVKNRKIAIKDFNKSLFPPIKINEEVLEVESTNDLITYYNALLDVFNKQDVSGAHASAYAWCVQIMEGMQLDELISETDEVLSEIIQNTYAENKEDGLFFYPEMIDLTAQLLKNDYDIYIVSASNIWSVRFAVTKYLNKILLDKYGLDGINPRQIFGINTLLLHKQTKQLYKDFYLINNNDNYLTFDSSELSMYKLTSLISYPVSTYEGKSAIIEKYISRDGIFLSAGDSPNDFSMLKKAIHHIWIARLEKKGYQKDYLKEFLNDSSFSIIQPTLTRKMRGFINSWNNLPPQLPNKNEISESVKIHLNDD